MYEMCYKDPRIPTKSVQKTSIWNGIQECFRYRPERKGESASETNISCPRQIHLKSRNAQGKDSTSFRHEEFNSLWCRCARLFVFSCGDPDQEWSTSNTHKADSIDVADAYPLQIKSSKTDSTDYGYKAELVIRFLNGGIASSQSSSQSGVQTDWYNGKKILQCYTDPTLTRYVRY